jgi:hypothetical protein
MYIANPIYDVAFKYMLEDNKIAKLFLSAIIGEKITELEFSAQEQTVELPPTNKEKTPLTVCRFDFSAKIETENGFKTVLIELQKAKFLSDLMRFRRYLGINYQKSDNTHSNDPDKARQIYCLYFLNYGMDLPKAPVLKVNYTVHDAHTGDEFPASGEFVSGLHHRSWIIQINELKEKRRNDLEKLLSIFDQENKTDVKYILDVDDESIPEEYKVILRRLRKAMEDPKKRREMEIEDEIVRELQDKERQIEETTKALVENKIALAEKTREAEEKEIALAEKTKEAEQNRKALSEKDIALQQALSEIAEYKQKFGKLTNIIKRK